MKETTTLIAIMPNGLMSIMECSRVEMRVEPSRYDVSCLGDSYQRMELANRRSIHAEVSVGAYYEMTEHKNIGEAYMALMNYAMRELVTSSVTAVLDGVTEARNHSVKLIEAETSGRQKALGEAATVALKKIIRAGERGKKFVAREAFIASGRQVKPKWLPKKSPAKKRAPAKKRK